jgi:hypothetical protein
MPETNFFWDPLSDNILQERDESGTVAAEYTTEPGLYGNVISQNRGGVESQCHYDAIGSTLAVTDDNQNVTDTFAYTAFGEVTERTGTAEVPFQYIGQKGYYTDGLTGQIVARRRPYEPLRARWLAVDPLPFTLPYRRTSSQSGVQLSIDPINHPNDILLLWVTLLTATPLEDQLGVSARDTLLYTYVCNRPHTAIDPSGLYTMDECMRDHCKPEYFIHGDAETGVFDLEAFRECKEDCKRGRKRPPGSFIQVCCRDIRVNCIADCTAQTLGLRHCWIKTSKKEAGLGPAAEGPLPTSPCYCTPTKIRDHSGQSRDSATNCVTLLGCSEQCVNDALELGKDMGDWGPNNQCNSFVKDVLTSCGCKNRCVEWTRVDRTLVKCTRWLYDEGFPIPR